MATVFPFHSADEGVDVYHNNDNCNDGKQIKPSERLLGIGDKTKLCHHCAVLNALED
jgi:hypothetical protein